MYLNWFVCCSDVITYFYLFPLFFFQVCAEAFNPDEEEEDTEQRVRVRESLHA